jgi:phosphoribosylanthranilate isomerase
MVKVKICGITNFTDARRAVEAGADFLGFNFYPQSPRYISPAKARAIVRRLPDQITVVGVFVNAPEEKMLTIARSVGLDFLQLHGEESPALIARLKRSYPVIKAVRVRNSFRPAQLAPYKRAAAFLLDGFHPRHHGGTGRKFDWSMARRARSRGRIFLAGGLTPRNVAEAIRAATPYAVDVCSGVESKPGKKDRARVESLMHAVRTAQRTTK